MQRRNFLKAAGASAAALSAPALVQAQSQTIELVLSSWAPDTNTIPREIVFPWAEAITELTGGRVTMRKLDKPVGPPPVHYEAVRSGQIDLAYSVHGYSGPDAFKRSKIGQFSFIGDSYGSATAFSNIYDRMLDADDEHKDVKLLGLFTHGPGHLFLRGKEVTTADDFKGLRIRTSGGYVSTLISRLGATPVAMPPGTAGPAMQSGEIDGVCFPYEAPVDFGALPYIEYATEFPGGLYNSTFFFAMNRAKWDMISPADQRTINDISKEFVAVTASKGFDVSDYGGHKACKAANMRIHRASDDLIKHVKTQSIVLEQEWVQTVKAEQYDGGAALRQLRRFTHVDQL